MLVWSIGSSLAEEGHDVIALTKTNFETKKLKHFEKNIKTWQYQPIESYFDQFRGMEKQLLQSGIKRALKGQPPEMRADMIEYLYNETIAIVENKELMNKIRDYKFDGAILDGFLLARFFVIIPYHFGIPIFTVTESQIDPVFQPISLPSYIPHLLSPFTEIMSFTERLSNFFTYIVLFNPTLRNLIIPQMPTDYLFKKFVRDDKIKHWDDLIAKSELFIITRNHMLEYAAPTWPNAVVVHSITVRPSKPLSENFEKLVSKHPDKKIVYVSFGSHGDLLPVSISLQLLEAFRSMDDIHFIWSYRFPENESINFPSNVDIVPWAPQNDLLGHDRVSVFITHGGNNGQSESVYHGKPMLCIPLFAEQPHNAVRIAYRKYGKYLFLHHFSKEKLQFLLREVLNNNVYAKNVRRASEIIKSQLVPDIKRITHEIVTVTKYGSSHLKSYGQSMPFYQYFSLDMLIFLVWASISALIVFSLVSYYAYKKLKSFFISCMKKKVE
ncbi:DgyrCDS3140 [Dimorphilus gyrociliatus]|uniref:UDP-glucuronosyltransferase n=1 Tax=Dimorphilus gyrociliatus TaxID=2664684 RepID=A0A7I8VDG1_9ANNE|nr:DgyrCDS3140 [Dimorphilus gyrociliatus]